MSQKSEKMEADVAGKGSKEARNRTPGPGWAGLPSTSAFRAINFELFVRPNKVVMAIGATAFMGSLGYILYMNLTDDKTKRTYVTLDEDGGTTARPRVSKWE